LGLTISQKLLRMMGGELRVTSTPGQGSTFWFDLDLPEVAGEMKPVTTETRKIVGFKALRHPLRQSLSRAESRDSGQTTPRILIVDDKDESRKVLKNLLLPLGFEIIEAVDGREAIDKAMGSQPELILMDLVMPKMDGFEAIHQIRQIPELNSTIVIAVSANVLEQTKEKAIGTGYHDFLAKPIARHLLFDTLQTHLNVEWIYADSISDLESFGFAQDRSGISDLRSPQSPIHNSRSEIIPPPVEELSSLYESAMIGDIMGIQEQIEKIDRLDPKFAPFAAEVRELARVFKISEIQRFIKQYL